MRSLRRCDPAGWRPGPRVKAFEEEFAALPATKHAIALDSATAGMHLALLAMDIGPGDEVITTPTTFAASVNVIIHAGATPVLADVRIDDYCIDPEAIERAITPRTKAILPVHHGGSACRMEEIVAIARRHNLRIVEDAAHGLGTHIDGEHIGGFGDATVFSFYPTKNVTSGRGGMLTTNDDAIAERCRLLALHGMSNDAWDRYTERGSWAYQVLAAGYNYTMSDFQAALGHAQFRRLDEFQRRRTEIALEFNRRFAELPETCAAHRTRRQHARVAPVRCAAAAGGPYNQPRRVHRRNERTRHRHVRPLHPHSPPSVLPRDIRLGAGRLPGRG